MWLLRGVKFEVHGDDETDGDSIDLGDFINVRCILLDIEVTPLA